LIQTEFRQALDLSEKFPLGINFTTGIVVVLSAPGPGDNEENTARIRTSVEISNMSRHILRDGRDSTYFSGAKSSGVVLRPRLVIVGTDEQLPAMNRVAMGLGMYDLSEFLLNPVPYVGIVPTDKREWHVSCLVSCGSREGPKANTKTQFEAVEPFARHWYHMTFVTSWYHVPRVARTATKQLPRGRNVPARFSVVGVPQSVFSVPVCRTVRGEAERILRYANKGDISSYADQYDLITVADFIDYFDRPLCEEGVRQAAYQMKRDKDKGRENMYSL
jgi:hypothetical protein